MPEVVLPEEEKQPTPPVFTNEPRNIEMKFQDGIGVVEGYVEPHICDAIISSFDYWYERKFITNDHTLDRVVAMDEHGKEMMQSIDTGMDGSKQFGKRGQLGRKDTQLFLETHDKAMALALAGWLGDCFKIYTDHYKGVIEGDPLSSTTYKIQKTPPGGGYHVWHCEDSGFLYRDRVLTWMVYLNDIPLGNGGATDFLYQKMSLQPTAGTIVFWPAAYTHMHRGAFLTGDVDKYIATGWFNREAPPNV